MLGENVNKTVYVIWAGAIVSGLFGVSMVLFPGAMDKAGDVIKTITNNFINPQKNEVALTVDIPDQENRAGFVYRNIGYDEHDLPIFETNTDDNNHYTEDDAKVSEWSKPGRELVDKYEPGTIYGDLAEAVSQSKSRYDYRSGLNSWESANKNVTSPFKATDVNGDDITGKIKFESIKVTKIETADGTTSTDDNAENDSGYWDDYKLKFNTEYSNYHDLFRSLYYYDASRHPNGTYTLDKSGNKVPWTSWNGIPDDSDVPIYTLSNDSNSDESEDGPDSDNSYYRVYPYISKSYLTATYSVTGKDGKKVTKSSSFVMKSLDSYASTRIER